MTETTSTSQPDTLISASLLATTGGLLDAVVYTLHGHVFANAMTGNVILLGITALSRDWLQAVRHLVPIIAFIAGVAASRYLRLLPQFYASLTVLALEMVVLFGAGLLRPSFPEMTFTAIIAFTSAFQVSTFRLVGRFAYNSTFITGNLRTASESFINQFLVSDPIARRHEAAQARKLFIICAFFLSGALIGAWSAPQLGNRALWLAEPLLLGTLARTLYLQADPRSRVKAFSYTNRRSQMSRHSWVTRHSERSDETPHWQLLVLLFALVEVFQNDAGQGNQVPRP